MFIVVHSENGIGQPFVNVLGAYNTKEEAIAHIESVKEVIFDDVDYAEIDNGYLYSSMDDDYPAIKVEYQEVKTEKEQVLDLLSAAGEFAQKFSEVKINTCVKCGGDANLFRDEVSEKEYEITKFCQSCQDWFYSKFAED